MRKRRELKLLSKTTFIYLIFTFLAFVLSGIFLTHEANQFINRDLDQYFGRVEHRIKWALEHGRDLDRLPPNIQVIPLSGPVDLSAFPQYGDTLTYNPGLDDMQRARKRVVAFEQGDRYYRTIMTKPVEDYFRFRDDIFRTVLPAFIILAVGIVGFNYLLSGYFFRPFNKILDLMKSYKVGQGTQIKTVDTTTREFNKMQDLFHQMIDRIEHDYRHLKEYTENMAHELRTPLAVIRNKTENLISDDAVMKRQNSAVKIIYDEINHLSRLGNTLNLITKIENGEFDNPVLVTTRPVIEKHVEAISELAELKSLSVETELSEEHRLLIDPYLLDIVLKNLLRNAVSYGAAEGPVRIITGENKLIISNYGPPMDIPGEKLFERFYRNNNSRGSLGLGLSLVKKICDVSGLAIEYRYEDGQHIFQIQPSSIS